MKPILFNTEMVKAILGGRKTTTRRVIKPQPAYELRKMDDMCHHGQWHEYSESPLCDPTYKSPWGAGYPGPVAEVGDVLYVRETFCPYDADHVIDGVKYAYKADATPDSEEARKAYGYKWKPSIFMPKEAARIFLRVANVKAERLQDITEDGAKAEGAKEKRDFIRIWNNTIPDKDSQQLVWSANPWVWVISFERCERPGDSNA